MKPISNFSQGGGMKNYLKDLNSEQKKAVVHKDGPLLILAGAGSGKTSTMTRRIAHLILSEGISPYNILAVTFTNKAAAEMRERVESLIGIQRGMWITTFHSACLRILRMYGDRLGYDRNFVIYDPGDQRTVIKNCIKEAGINEKEITPPYVLSIISDCKEKGISPSEFERGGIGMHTSKIASLFIAYERTLKTNNAMDFDDLILHTVKLFKNDREVLAYFRDRFRYIMVDEYQDTNHMQYRVIRMLAEGHNNICVVGDDDQCIYQWRGADINNILDFEKDFRGAKVIKLEQNYRSFGNILAAANSIIKNNDGRKPKRLWTKKKKGEKVKYYQADDDKDEARYVALQIDILKGGDKQYKDFAVLYRTNAQSRRFEEAFISRGTPYRVLGGHRYYDRKEVKDMVAYLRLLVNPEDDLSMERIINEPRRGVGAKTLAALKAMVAEGNGSIFSLLLDKSVLSELPGRAPGNLEHLAHVITKLSVQKDRSPIIDIYDELLTETGYLTALRNQKTIEAESRIENLLEFRTVIYDYEKEKRDAGEEASLSGFMESIALMSDVDNHAPEENAVVLMTIHSAKGLEFPVVFLPGMEDGLFPGYRALNKKDALEEERRLCYVGMTRAMERLYMISARQRMLYGKIECNPTSVFLRELDKRLVEGDAIFINRRFDPYSSTGGFEFEGDFHRPFSRSNFKAGVKNEGSKPGWPTLSGSDLACGDRVNHTKFGEGEVTEVDGNTATVIFDQGGVKKLALNVAPLTKVSTQN